MVFSVVGIMFKIFFAGSLVTSGPISTALSAASTAKTIYDQASLENPTLAERGLAMLPFKVKNLSEPKLTKP
jgi:hypothetical protein